MRAVWRQPVLGVARQLRRRPAASPSLERGHAHKILMRNRIHMHACPTQLSSEQHFFLPCAVMLRRVCFTALLLSACLAAAAAAQTLTQAGTFSDPVVVEAGATTPLLSLANGTLQMDAAVPELCSYDAAQFAGVRKLVVAYNETAAEPRNVTFSLCNAGVFTLNMWHLICPRPLADATGADAADAGCVCLLSGWPPVECDWGWALTFVTIPGYTYLSVVQANLPDTGANPPRNFTLTAALRSNSPANYTDTLAALLLQKAAVANWAAFAEANSITGWSAQAAVSLCSNWTGITCGAGGNVTALNWGCGGTRRGLEAALGACRLGAAGALAPELSWITSLQALSLAGNNFTGTLPDSLAELPGLQQLVLDDNPGLNGAAAGRALLSGPEQGRMMHYCIVILHCAHAPLRPWMQAPFLHPGAGLADSPC